MIELKTAIATIFSLLSTAIGYIFYLLGGFDKLIEYLIVLIAIDFFIGSYLAYRGKSDKTESGFLSSKCMLDGVFRKCLILLVVMVFFIFGDVTGVSSIRNLVIMFFICVESISILEHAIQFKAIPPEFRKHFDIFYNVIKARCDSDQDAVKNEQETKNE